MFCTRNKRRRISKVAKEIVTAIPEGMQLTLSSQADSVPPSPNKSMQLDLPKSNSASADTEFEDMSQSSGHSSCNTDDEMEGITDMVSFLKSWSQRHNITLSALSELLKTLRKYHATLPKDARTLLQSSNSRLPMLSIFPGHYYHFGLKHGLSFVLRKTSTSNGHHLRISLNIDGLPLFNSSQKGFWVLLASIEGIQNSVFIVGLYFGTNKPASSTTLLQPCIEELKDLEDSHLEVDGKEFSVTLYSVCCDTPARYFIKNIKSYTGYYGCDRCEQKGDYLGRHVYLETTASKRTDSSFRQKRQIEHHHEDSAFLVLNIDMISHFPLDYMHSVCKGVVLKLLLSFKTGRLPFRLSSKIQDDLDASLSTIRAFMPSDFSRLPRSFKCHLGLWKATELREFILYVGPAIVPKLFHSQKMVETFMLLFGGVFLLAHPLISTRSEWLNFARSLLVKFIDASTDLYGPEFLVYNVHSLVHLPDDVEKFGSLDQFSCFKYENFLRFIKRKVKSSRQPLQQVVNRVLEQDVCLGLLDVSVQLPPPGSISFYNFFLKPCSIKDSFFMSKDGDICEVCDYNEVTMDLVCYLYGAKTDAFTSPFSSSMVDIYYVDVHHYRKKRVLKFNEVYCKMMLLSTKWGTYASPLLHTISA